MRRLAIPHCAAVCIAPTPSDGNTLLYAAIAVCVALIVVLMFFEEKQDSDAAAEEEATAFDAFAGGYPVPPMPDQIGIATRSTSGQEH